MLQPEVAGVVADGDVDVKRHRPGALGRLRAVLGDVLASGAATVVRLTKIFCRAAESAIVVSAHTIN